METLVVLAQHRNQACRRSKSHISDRFETSSSSGFKGINCRTFQSGTGILPSPKPVFASYGNAQEFNSPEIRSETPKPSRKSSPIAITPKPSPKFSSSCDDLSYSELWAGPTYCNSPPPSSLPIPKFSLRQKRSVSLDLPDSDSDIELKPEAKSAPASPVRDCPLSLADDFLLGTASATQNLRRILNLDLMN
ncbi:uncharacterized protein LOC110024301 [Phalaenopsis equestris]|uniref:uncharacterized protein LOC110024301 n=1 Tax=Phalaenopsis equestris TaxID=78828 RepID=UPI0009E630A8|nr:uncharacterized protein LOC110024301 [Phalaenopsis equestris]XP_020579845.1 uncharacterized protein LOC110024301 [Phalaenopsis equestris]